VGRATPARTVMRAFCNDGHSCHVCAETAKTPLGLRGARQRAMQSFYEVLAGEPSF